MRLADRFDAFLVDLDGVVWRGEQPIDGAADTINELRDAGKRVVFLTNNASLSPREYAAKLMRHRIPTQPGDVVSSAHAVVDYLKRTLRLSRGDRVHVCGTVGLAQVLKGAGLIPTSEGRDVGAVVVAWNPKLTLEDVRRAADLARAGVPLVGANRDATYPSSDGLLPGTGAILAAVETASGVRAHTVGKPAPELFRHGLEQAGAPPERTLVIGDRLETDVAGARAAGLASALVLTGVSSLDDVEGGYIKPDWILDRRVHFVL
jgi:HAD superfamily hydrolase (TIGR01450 family)